MDEALSQLLLRINAHDSNESRILTKALFERKNNPVVEITYDREKEKAGDTRLQHGVHLTQVSQKIEAIFRIRGAILIESAPLRPFDDSFTLLCRVFSTRSGGKGAKGGDGEGKEASLVKVKEKRIVEVDYETCTEKDVVAANGVQASSIPGMYKVIYKNVCDLLKTPSLLDESGVLLQLQSNL